MFCPGGISCFDEGHFFSLIVSSGAQNIQCFNINASVWHRFLIDISLLSTDDSIPELLWKKEEDPD